MLPAAVPISLNAFSAFGGFNDFREGACALSERKSLIPNQSSDGNVPSQTRETNMRYLMASAALLLLSAAIIGCGSTSETDTTPAVTDPVEATSVSLANTKCPIMGGTPTEELTVDYDGKTIGFCCDGCPQKWATLDEDEKAEKFAKVDAHAGHDHDVDGHDADAHDADGHGHSDQLGQ